MAPQSLRLVWLGLVVTGAAVLLAVSVLLPWVRVTVPLPVGLPAAVAARLSNVHESFNGIADGIAWGWLTLGCALAAGALGLVGGVTRNGRLGGAATIPGAVGLVSPIVVVFRFDSIKSTMFSHHGLPAAMQASIHGSLEYGWYLALVMTVLVIACSVATFFAHGK